MQLQSEIPLAYIPHAGAAIIQSPVGPSVQCTGAVPTNQRPSPGSITPVHPPTSPPLAPIVSSSLLQAGSWPHQPTSLWAGPDEPSGRYPIPLSLWAGPDEPLGGLLVLLINEPLAVSPVPLAGEPWAGPTDRRTFRVNLEPLSDLGNGENKFSSKLH